MACQNRMVLGQGALVLSSRRTWTVWVPLAGLLLSLWIAGCTSALPKGLSAEKILRDRCFHCHGENGVAESDVYVLDRERMLRDKTVVRGDPQASRLIREIVAKRMPMDMDDGLPKAEIQVLRDWVRKGAPAFATGSQPEARQFINDATQLFRITNDLRELPVRYRRYYRYFSITHLYNAGVPEAELEGYRLALSKLLNSLSWHRMIVVPKAIDPAKTILRIDIRDYSWTESKWNHLIWQYPYTYLPKYSDTIRSLSGAAVPFVRADWFVANASIPPLYHALLDVPATLEELEKKLHVEASRSLGEEKGVLRAGIRNSGVSKHNRVVERHESPFGAYWKSFDFSSSTVEQNIFRNPLHFMAAGGEMVFSLPNGLHGYMIVDAAGKRLDSAPISIVSDDTNRNDPVVTNGRSCMACHIEGVKRAFRNDVHAMLEEIADPADPPFDLEGARALYIADSAIQEVLESDMERYRGAIEATGGKLSRRTTTEPVYVLASKFALDMPVALAAAELGLQTEELKSRIKGSPELIELGLSQLLAPDGAIKREVWEKDFQRIATTMGYRLLDDSDRIGFIMAPSRVDTKKLIGKWKGEAIVWATGLQEERQMFEVTVRNDGKVAVKEPDKDKVVEVDFSIEGSSVLLGNKELKIEVHVSMLTAAKLHGRWNPRTEAESGLLQGYQVRFELERVY